MSPPPRWTLLHAHVLVFNDGIVAELMQYICRDCDPIIPLLPGRSPCGSTPALGLAPNPRLGFKDEKVVELLHRIPPAADVKRILHNYRLCSRRNIDDDEKLAKYNATLPHSRSLADILTPSDVLRRHSLVYHRYDIGCDTADSQESLPGASLSHGGMVNVSQEASPCYK